MKTIEIKERKKNWQMKWAEMTANMQDYNNPQTTKLLKGRAGEEARNPKQTGN